MSNYRFRSQFQHSFSAKAVSLRAKLLFDASGDATIVSDTGMGIASISHDATGVYTITLGKKYAGLMILNAMHISAAASAAPLVRISSDDVASAGTIELSLADAADAAADPADGEIIAIEIILNDSSLRY